MNTQSSPMFVTKGPLDPESNKRVYVLRQEDTSAMNCILAGAYVALLGARQTGKTSLLYALRHRLLMQGDTKVAMVDLSGSTYQTEGWYSFLCRRILDELNVTGKARKGLLLKLSPSNFDEFLKKVAGEVPEKKVILFDEIGAIPAAISGPFLWSIRHAYNTRHTPQGQPFAQYVFVLAGAHELQRLTRSNGTVSPFNISEKIYMTDLTWEGTQQLLQVLGECGCDVKAGTSERIYGQAGGHPYFTQRLCHYLEEKGKNDVITRDSVDLAVTNILAGDDCLSETMDRLKGNSEITTLTKRILQGESVKFDRNDEPIVALELAGVIKRDSKDNCAIRNRICEAELRRHFNIAETEEASSKEPRQYKTPSTKRIRVLVIALACLVVEICYFFSGSWVNALSSVPIAWLFTGLVFYLKDIKLKDNTNDPDRVLAFNRVTVESQYDPVIKTNRKHSVLIQVRHKQLSGDETVKVTLKPLSQNLGIESEFSHTFTEPQESHSFILVLRRKATLWTLLFPFTERQLVEFNAEVANEKRSALIKLNADYTSSLVLSFIASIIGGAVLLVDLAYKTGFLKH